MYGTWEELQAEIKTIRPRKIEIKLSDADVKRVSKKAAKHGLTVEELIENFIGDLVDGTRNNGSDERMYANEWLERCWFGALPENNFLVYLLEYGKIEFVVKSWQYLEYNKENLSDDVLDECQKTIDKYWEDYRQRSEEKECGAFDEEMKKVLEYWERYQSFLDEGQRSSDVRNQGE
jgi:hypothetical protein